MSSETPERVIYAQDIATVLLQSVATVLNEFSSQGLELWVDAFDRWHWMWRPVGIEATQSYDLLGEAILDAVLARYPAAFACPYPRPDDRR